MIEILAPCGGEDCLPAALKGEATPLDISEDAMRRMTR